VVVIGKKAKPGSERTFPSNGRQFHKIRIAQQTCTLTLASDFLVHAKSLVQQFEALLVLRTANFRDDLWHIIF